ncbi:hypothetical protein F5Y16DRAFT_361997 [Xylariaceae sp. FL0255]|nr:hypothetical protein F5Y16DRAFT_361997 [Xylariaceae sp. FL0255]
MSSLSPILLYTNDRQAKMQLTSLIKAALLVAQLSRADCFPSDVIPGIHNLQGYIDTVISDLTQKKYDVVANDYSSTGRSLAFLEEDIQQKICNYTLATSASTQDQALAYLHGVKAELHILAQDAKNDDRENGIKALCRAVNLYGGVAAYVDSVRTDGQ